MTKCNQCQQVKEENCFSKNQKRCKSCNNTNVKNYYANNPEYQLSLKMRAAESEKKCTEALKNFKLKYGCRFCDEKEPRCLQFHHFNPSEKKFQINGNGKRNIQSYKDEISKCEILCANCHIKVHANILHLETPRVFDLDQLIKTW